MRRAFSYWVFRVVRGAATFRGRQKPQWKSLHRESSIGLKIKSYVVVLNPNPANQRDEMNILLSNIQASCYGGFEVIDTSNGMGWRQLSALWTHLRRKSSSLLVMPFGTSIGLKRCLALLFLNWIFSNVKVVAIWWDAATSDAILVLSLANRNNWANFFLSVSPHSLSKFGGSLAEGSRSTPFLLTKLPQLEEICHDQKRKLFDVWAPSSNYPARQNFLNPILAGLAPDCIICRRFQSNRADYLKDIRRSRIALNTNGALDWREIARLILPPGTNKYERELIRFVGREITGRNFVVLGLGVPLLTNRGSGLEEWFVEDMHFFLYSDPEEAIRKIKFLLSREGEKLRDLVAKTGQRRLRELATNETFARQVVHSFGHRVT